MIIRENVTFKIADRRLNVAKAQEVTAMAIVAGVVPPPMCDYTIEHRDVLEGVLSLHCQVALIDVGFSHRQDMYRAAEGHIVNQMHEHLYGTLIQEAIPILHELLARSTDQKSTHLLIDLRELIANLGTSYSPELRMGRF